MAIPDRIQGSRFELKYLVNERCAREIRDFARKYLEPDAHGRSGPHCAYAISSLYLDSPDLTLCQATLDGHRNRFKLRIRFYDDSSESPAYFEIKRRVDGVIRKERASVRRTSIPRLLAGHRPRRLDLIRPSNGFDTLQCFWDLRNAIQARPQVIVSYMREAYVTPNGNDVRMTFDRRLSARKHDRELGLGNSQRPFHPRLCGVILELKFTNRFPRWMAEMAQIFDLERCRMPKYVTCVRAVRTLEFRSLPENQQVGA